MNRLVASLLLSLLLGVTLANATPKNPGFARDEAPEMRSADWYLLCDERNDCSIRGVTRQSKRPGQPRALILLDRAAEKAARWFVRIVFLDNDGDYESNVAHPQDLRLFKVTRWHNRAPVRLNLEGSAGNPVYYVPRRQVPSFLALLMNSRRTEIRQKGDGFAAMPHGNLRKLLNYADREQRKHVPVVDPQELAENGGRQDLTILSSLAAMSVPRPCRNWLSLVGNLTQKVTARGNWRWAQDYGWSIAREK